MSEERKYLQGDIFVSPNGEADTSSMEQELSFGHYALRRLKENHANKTILVDDESGRKWTGLQLYEQTMNIACGLVDLLDFQQNQSVIIDFDHSDTSCILALAVISAGGVVACAYPTDPYPELVSLSKKIDPKFFFSHREKADWGIKLAEELGHEVKTIVMDNIDKAPTECTTKHMHINTLLSYNYKTAKTKDRVPVACQNLKRDLAIVTRTSGTTGNAKVAASTHWNCLTTGFSFPDSLDSSSINFANIQSLNYVSGRIFYFATITMGFTSIIIKSFSPASLCQAIQVHKINVAWFGAANFYSFITFPDLDKFSLGSLVSIFPMGAHVTYIKEMGEFLAKYPNIRYLRQAYGSTEFAGCSDNWMTPEVYLEDCSNCGVLNPSVKAKVVDPESGKLMGTNEIGLLHLMSPTLFPGYYDVSLVQKEGKESPFIADSSVFDEDGFYKTGDLGYFNEHGQLFIIGRQKEIIDFFGTNINPFELEQIIYEHPAVKQVCVIGIAYKLSPTARCPRAFIVVKSGYYTDSQIELVAKSSDSSSSSEPQSLEHIGVHKLCRMETGRRRQIEEDIMQFVTERVSFPKRLRGGLVLLDEFKTGDSSGKVDKNYLRNLTFEQIELYGDPALM